jgi:hypothetical protein
MASSVLTPTAMKKSNEPFERGTKKQDSKLALQPSKIAPKKNMLGGDTPNKMYLPKNEPAKASPAPAPKKQTYKAPKSKQVFGNVNKMNARSKSVKRCK